MLPTWPFCHVFCRIWHTHLKVKRFLGCYFSNMRRMLCKALYTIALKMSSVYCRVCAIYNFMKCAYAACRANYTNVDVHARIQHELSIVFHVGLFGAANKAQCGSSNALAKEQGMKRLPGKSWENGWHVRFGASVVHSWNNSKSSSGLICWKGMVQKRWFY